LESRFLNPPAEARPWVFWYWVNAAVTREGISRELQAMHDAGLGGAYLCFIKGATNPPLTDKPAVQLTPEWWQLVEFAIHEADRLDLRLGFHASDGFATAGGPWITPELSMQKLTWSAIDVEGGRQGDLVLPSPPSLEGYYRDIAVFALPAASAQTDEPKPRLSASSGLPEAELNFLTNPGQKGTYRSEDDGWIQFSYAAPFTARSVRIWPATNNYPSLRPRLEASDDGVHFREVVRLQPPSHGWRDFDEPHTYALPPTTARFFRFVFEKSGMEAGNENLETAKWSTFVKLQRLELSSRARIEGWEGKTGLVWRVSAARSAQQDVAQDSPPSSRPLILGVGDLKEGKLRCDLPAGRWTLLRIGSTSTGRRNETAGGGIGLECDKLNPVAVRLQFDRWFDEILRRAGSAARAVKVFHVDSWECGSQNWTPALLEEFRKRRGYDPLPLLPAMAGYPVGGAEQSEGFLRDMRLTLSELVDDNFYGTLAELARARGCQFSTESAAPVMVADNLKIFSRSDLPMGEFWLRSPTHDKPNDVYDAVSGAHIYGKRIVQAEAFTELRIAWDETPALLKPLADRSFSLGVNRIVHHVLVHNPWRDKHPGITLGGVGLFFQPDQTWWAAAPEWNRYLSRCQALLQEGDPVVDLAVYTGGEMPRRALLPPDLLGTLPGLFGAEELERERSRLENKGQPVCESPAGVKHGANVPDLSTWSDPLRGYAYDSINSDVLLHRVKLEGGRLVLPGGASYAALVVPGRRALSPDAGLISQVDLSKIKSLHSDGATLIWAEPTQALDAGKGRLHMGAVNADTLDFLGIARDFVALDLTGAMTGGILWNHRRGADWDLYFVSNQSGQPRPVTVSLRETGRIPELWNPVTSERSASENFRIEQGRTLVPLQLDAHGSVFIVLKAANAQTTDLKASAGAHRNSMPLDGAWTLSFAKDAARSALSLKTLGSWTTLPGGESFSGTASYRLSFAWTGSSTRGAWLDLGRVGDVARVRLNGIDCGVVWTAPMRVEIGKALRTGANELVVEVSNTWHNRLLADSVLPPERRTSWLSSPFTGASKKPLDAGLFGPVYILTD
jgi:hypothetical protein